MPIDRFAASGPPDRHRPTAAPSRGGPPPNCSPNSWAATRRPESPARTGSRTASASPSPTPSNTPASTSKTPARRNHPRHREVNDRRVHPIEIVTLTLATTVYMAEEDTGLGTIPSGNLLRFRWTAIRHRRRQLPRPTRRNRNLMASRFNSQRRRRLRPSPLNGSRPASTCPPPRPAPTRLQRTPASAALPHQRLGGRTQQLRHLTSHARLSASPASHASPGTACSPPAGGAADIHVHDGSSWDHAAAGLRRRPHGGTPPFAAGRPRASPRPLVCSGIKKANSSDATIETLSRTAF